MKSLIVFAIFSLAFLSGMTDSAPLDMETPSTLKFYDLFDFRDVKDERKAYGLIDSIVDGVLAEVSDVVKAAENIVTIAAVGGEMLLHALQQFVDSHRDRLGDRLADLITKLIEKVMNGLDPIVDKISDF